MRNGQVIKMRRAPQMSKKPGVWIFRLCCPSQRNILHCEDEKLSWQFSGEGIETKRLFKKV